MSHRHRGYVMNQESIQEQTFLERLAWLLEHADIEPMKTGVGWALLASAIALLLPIDTFKAGATYAIMARLGSELSWGVGVSFLFFIYTLSAVFQWRLVHMLSVALVFVWWLAIFVLFVLAAYQARGVGYSMGIGIASTLVFMSFWAFCRSVSQWAFWRNVRHRK